MFPLFPIVLYILCIYIYQVFLSIHSYFRAFLVRFDLYWPEKCTAASSYVDAPRTQILKTCVIEGRRLQCH